MEAYIKNIKYSWYNLTKLPKLNRTDIAKVNEPMRMYLYAFYGYFNMLNKYNLEQLSITINYPGDNLMLLAIYIKKNNIKLIEYLESQGLDIHYKNKDNLNTYLCAIQMNKIKLIHYLENRGINIYIIFNMLTSYKFAIKYSLKYNNLRIVKKINKNLNHKYKLFYYADTIFVTRQIKLRLNRFKISYISGF